MEKSCEKECIEIDIKGYFFKKFIKNVEPLETKLEEFVNEFKKKYVERVSHFRDTVEAYCCQTSRS